MKRRKIMTVFGTRPEAIKVAPIIHELERRPHKFQTVNVSSGQHQHLLEPCVSLFRLRVDHHLGTYLQGKNIDDLSRNISCRVADILNDECPDLMLVQGDTSTAVGAAAAGAFMQIPVGHIEAGLRSGDERAPFPEELYRKQISRMASFHFAPTPKNRVNLLSEGIPDSRIFVTGNTIIDSLHLVLSSKLPGARIERILAETSGFKRIVLTMHRRENIGYFKRAFAVLRRFVASHTDYCLLFPVHPNPAVCQAAEVLRGGPRIRLLDPLNYSEFIHLVRHAWIIVTDSGGIQEEAPTLGKPVLLFRAKTERPEAVDTGVVKLIGDSPSRLRRALEELNDCGAVVPPPPRDGNPFGNGTSANMIVNVLESLWEQPNEIVQKALFQAPRNSVATVGTVLI